jgi:hypothetical protein
VELMQTVYKYDPQTRHPRGPHECRVDPRTGTTLRPHHSLDTPPPEYPKFVEVLAGAGTWWVDIEVTRANALADVDRIHAEHLRQLTGNATIEERDTWAPKSLAARALLAGAADETQEAMLELEAGQRGVTAEVLAGIILARGVEFERLIGLAGAMRAKARSAFTAATTLEEMLHAGAALRAEVSAAVAQGR